MKTEKPRTFGNSDQKAGKFTNYTLQENVACWKNFETVRTFHFKTGNGKNIPTQNNFYFL